MMRLGSVPRYYNSRKFQSTILVVPHQEKTMELMPLTYKIRLFLFFLAILSIAASSTYTVLVNESVTQSELKEFILLYIRSKVSLGPGVFGKPRSDAILFTIRNFASILGPRAPIL